MRMVYYTHAQNGAKQ